MSILTHHPAESASRPARIHRLGLGVFAAGLLLPTVAKAQGYNEIDSYKATIDIQKDGWLEVTEEIVVRASEETLQGDFFRDVPTLVPRPGGSDYVTAPLEIVHALVDNRPARYVRLGVGGLRGRGVVRIRITGLRGDVAGGEHTYSLTYRTSRRLTFEDGRTQLSWNVTGNGWRLPIRSAAAQILLPGEVPEDAVTMEAWTGRKSAGDAHVTAAFSANPGSGSTARFVTTAPLRRAEGLTVRLTFPDGLVPAPPPEEVATWTGLDRTPYIRGAQLVLAVLALYGVMWILVGRDPRGRTVVVQYDPPEGLSPAALGYLDRRGYHPSQLTAAVVSLAIKGALRIECEDRRWTLRRNDTVPDTLTHDERILLEKLIGGGHTYLILGISLQRVRDAKQALRRELGRTLERRYFRANRWWFAAGILLSVGGFVNLARQTPWFAEAGEGLLQGAVLIVLGGIFVRALRWSLREWRTDVAEKSPSLAAAGCLPLIWLLVLGAFGLMARRLYLLVPLPLVVVAVLLVLINSLFYRLLERPTLAGQGLLNHLEGFKRFLMATEGSRIDKLQPDRTPLQFFEELLPYAIALDVASPWASRFGAALAAGNLVGAPSGGAGWYVGTEGGSAETLTSSLSGGLSSSLAEAASTQARKRVRSTRSPT